MYSANEPCIHANMYPSASYLHMDGSSISMLYHDVLQYDMIRMPRFGSVWFGSVCISTVRSVRGSRGSQQKTVRAVLQFARFAIK